MIALLFWILIIACFFIFFAFIIEVAFVLFLGMIAIVLWGHGIIGQAIVVVIGLLIIFRKS